MPLATVSFQGEGEKFDLKSCDGGYVFLRHMTYGEKMVRAQMSSAMRFKGGGKRDDFTGEMDLSNAKVTEFEFSKCIVDHNLEDEAGQKLNFGKANDVRRLHPRIGEEISIQIAKMNNFDEEDEEGEGNS
jgi:hypothetical protein